jgi:DNA-binding PadR family transcriptional regulator
VTKRAHLGDLEELVLLAVMRLGDDAHGGRIRDELKHRAGRSVSISTIYVTLLRLEEKGHARSWMGESSAARGGKAKRHYAISPAGLHALQERRAVRERMWDGAEEAAHA